MKDILRFIILKNTFLRETSGFPEGKNVGDKPRFGCFPQILLCSFFAVPGWNLLSCEEEDEDKDDCHNEQSDPDIESETD